MVTEYPNSSAMLSIKILNGVGECFKELSAELQLSLCVKVDETILVTEDDISYSKVLDILNLVIVLTCVLKARIIT